MLTDFLGRMEMLRLQASRAALVLVGTAWFRTAAAAPTSAPTADRYELGGLPALSGSTDIGFGWGAVGTLAHFSPGAEPYGWRLSVLVFMAAKVTAERGFQLGYHDDSIKLDVPQLFGSDMRLHLRLSFGRFTNSGYYGLGNAAKVDPGRPSRHHQYDRIYPAVSAQLRLPLALRQQMRIGARFLYNWINVYPKSRLAEDLAAGDPQIDALLRGTDDHALFELQLGWLYDSRDHEYAPTRGMFHEISWRWSANRPQQAFGGLNVTARFFYPLYRDVLVLAGRAVVDLLVGDPPFYELARQGGLYPQGAPGGGKGVRGVPTQRYHGRIKLLTNGELRARLLPFSIASQRFLLGAVAFVDAGRVFVDYDPERSRRFDGDGLGIKVGLGGGLRLRWGETFIVRADVAWSPDANPVGVYIDVRHVF